MDPYKSSSVHPQGFDEKSSMGQAPPPPYPAPNPGYPQPGLGYSIPPQGHAPPSQFGGAGYAQAYPMAQQYPGQMAAVTVQPTVYVTRGPLTNPANDYLGYSIFTMLCCCLPLGIAALIYSISTREANHVGDQLAAERSSRTARILNHVALGFGLGLIILFVILTVVGSAL